VREDPVIKGIRGGEKAFAGPELVVVDLTNRCNLACIGCWSRSPLLSAEAHGAPQADEDLPEGLARQLIKSLAQMGVKEINFSGGGEPLLYRGLLDLVQAAGGGGLCCTINTNFTLADEKLLRRIVEAGTKKLLVSVWAGDPDTYRRTHPGTGRGAFEHVRRMLAELVKLRGESALPGVTLVNVISSRNVSGFEEMVKFAIGLGVESVWFTPVDAPAEGMRELLLTAEQLRGLRETALRCAEKYDRLTLRDGRVFRMHQIAGFIEKISSSRAAEGYYHWDVIDSLPCYAGWVTARVCATGDVCPCCKADRFPLGNLREESFEKIWHSERYNRFRKKAVSLSKKDRYFSRIGCPRICDNWWQIREVQARLEEAREVR
jgi:MoaA/NifB/PqqE/SkfB family radical SAM enzyme